MLHLKTKTTDRVIHFIRSRVIFLRGEDGKLDYDTLDRFMVWPVEYYKRAIDANEKVFFLNYKRNVMVSVSKTIII